MATKMEATARAISSINITLIVIDNCMVAYMGQRQSTT
jgi:hypothetical protein